MRNDEIYYIEFGNLLRRGRMNKNLSLNDVVEATKGHKSKNMLSKYENGIAKISANTANILCSLYGLDPEEISAEAERRTAEIVAERTGSLASSNIRNTIVQMIANPYLTEQDLGSIYDFVQFMIEKRK